MTMKLIYKIQPNMGFYYKEEEGDEEEEEGEEEEKKKKILVGGGGDTYKEVIYGRNRDWLQTPLQAGFIVHNGTHNNIDLVVVQCHSKSIILYSRFQTFAVV
jgi:hypothetical protein